MDIIFVEPENPSNIGHLARVMKNFGQRNLLLVNPKCDVHDVDALRISKYAIDILKNAKIVKSFDVAIARYDYIFATSAKVNTDYNILRSPVDIDVIKRLANTKRKVAVVFGREGSGLTNEEIKKCDGMITIKTSVDYPAMNISHAAAILLYEIFKGSQSKKIAERIQPIQKDVKNALLKEMYSVVHTLSFDAKRTELQKVLWKKIVGGGLLTNREAMALFGFFKKIR